MHIYGQVLKSECTATRHAKAVSQITHYALYTYRVSLYLAVNRLKGECLASIPDDSAPSATYSKLYLSGVLLLTSL